MIIEESGMLFGDFDPENLYYIEHEKKYTEIKVKGVSSVEFILLRNEKLIFVEAKSSAPNPSGEKGKERFEEFIGEIGKKFVDSLAIFERTWIEKGLPEKIENAEIKECSLIFVLVINGFEKEWLVPVRDGLQGIISSFRTMCILWQPKVVVINEKQAERKGLIK